MSALSNGVKIRFFEFLKGLFRRPVQNGAVRDEPAEAGFESAPLPVANTSRFTNHEAAHGGPQNGNGLCLPLQPVLNSLPLELRGRVRQTDVGDLTVSVPLVTVLSQLASGSVKVPFGRVRQAAPNVFTGGPERDQVLVSLPLGEILARLNPALLVRRPAQRQIQVPAEIRSPFDANGQGLVFSVGNVKPEPRISPTPRAISPVPATPTIPARASTTSTPTLPPATAIRMPSTLSFRRDPAPLPPPTFHRNPAPPPPAAIPFAPASPPPKPASEPVRLMVGLTALAESW